MVDSAKAVGIELQEGKIRSECGIVADIINIMFIYINKRSNIISQFGQSGAFGLHRI